MKLSEPSNSLPVQNNVQLSLRLREFSLESEDVNSHNLDPLCAIHMAT